MPSVAQSTDRVVVPASAPRLALVLFNGKYPKAELENPPNDAATMADVLRRLHFDVIEVGDTDGKRMWDAIEQFSERLKTLGPDAVGFLFYAGHGLEIDGENYILPIDAIDMKTKAGVRRQAVAVKDIAQQLRRAGNQLNVLVFDACRNNPFRGLPFRATDVNGLKSMGPVVGMLIASSTAAGDFAYDGTGGNNSPYTHALSEAMVKPGKTLEDVFKNVRRLVMKATDQEQIPWESSSLLVDFYFIQPPQQVPAAQQLVDAGRQTHSIELLELVIHKYGGSPAAAEADKLLQQFRREAAAIPPAPPPKAIDNDARIEEMAEAVMRRAADTGSAEAYELVALMFPKTRFAPIAAERAAALRAQEAAMNAQPQLDGPELVRGIQSELLRVGCLNGAASGRFDAPTIVGLRAFSTQTDARFYWHRPTMAALRALKKEDAGSACRIVRSAGPSKCLQVKGETICE